MEWLSIAEKRKELVVERVDVDIGQTLSQTYSDALPISAQNLDRPHCCTEEVELRECKVSLGDFCDSHWEEHNYFSKS